MTLTEALQGWRLEGAGQVGQNDAAAMAEGVTAHLAAILADPETVEAVARAVQSPGAHSPRGSWLDGDDWYHWQARAAIAVIAERLGLA